jgi:pimeloyl-ACP methyl ester carboxylesterase
MDVARGGLSVRSRRLTTDDADPEGQTAMSPPLMIPAADTQLYAVDAPGGTPALLFLSGAFGTVQNWSRVIRRLEGNYRTVRFDARARGKSGKIGRLLRTGGRR